jgi:hypothetical protein
MSATTFVIYIRAEGWRVGCVAGGKARIADVDGQDALAARRALQAMGWTGQAVVVALPTASCFSASIPLAGLPRQDRVAMGFRFEEELPLSAEELVSDFVMGDGKALAVGARIDQVRGVIDSLESVGVAVQSVSPVAMLAAQGWSDQITGELLLMVAEDGDHGNLIVMKDGKPLAWAMTPAAEEDVRRQAALMLAKVPDLLPIVSEADFEASAARAAEQIASGREKAWVEFRRGTLGIADPWRQYRRPINGALAAACVLLIVMSAVMFYRGQRYARLADEKDRALSGAFHAQFPDWATPANVRTVLESERRKRMAQTNGDLPAEARGSALETMRAALAKVPGDVRISMDRMMFSDQTFTLQGKARSMEDADALAKAARAGGLDVPPPLTRKEADGFWGFTLSGGKIAAQTSAAAKEGP